MDSPLLARTGAVPAQGIDAGVAAHYGDPYAEQRVLARAAGLVDRSHREIVRISGEDRRSWLHSLTTQDLQHLEPGTAAQALVLSLMGPQRPATPPDGAMVAMPDAFGMDVVVPKDRLSQIAAAVEDGGAAV